MRYIAPRSVNAIIPDALRDAIGHKGPESALKIKKIVAELLRELPGKNTPADKERVGRVLIAIGLVYGHGHSLRDASAHEGVGMSWQGVHQHFQRAGLPPIESLLTDKATEQRLGVFGMAFTTEVLNAVDLEKAFDRACRVARIEPNAMAPFKESINGKLPRPSKQERVIQSRCRRAAQVLKLREAYSMDLACEVAAKYASVTQPIATKFYDAERKKRALLEEMDNGYKPTQALERLRSRGIEVSRSAACRYLREAGRSKGKTRIPKDKQEILVNAFRKGETVLGAARRVGVNHNTATAFFVRRRELVY